MKRKRILSLLLALTVMATMLMAVPLTANAADEETETLAYNSSSLTKTTYSDGETLVDNDVYKVTATSNGVTISSSECFKPTTTGGYNYTVSVDGISKTLRGFLLVTPKVDGTLSAVITKLNSGKMAVIADTSTNTSVGSYTSSSNELNATVEATVTSGHTYVIGGSGTDLTYTSISLTYEASTDPSISFDTDSYTIYTADGYNTVELAPTVKNIGDYTILWSSGDTSIATVEPDADDVTKATVTAIGEGTAVITASVTVDGTVYSDTCTVSVKDLVPVTAITISGESTVTAGLTTTLTASVEPEDATYKTVTWTSSNTGVATVDDSGVVTGVAKGNVTITATATDGTGAYGEFSITVNAAPMVEKSSDGGVSDLVTAPVGGTTTYDLVAAAQAVSAVEGQETYEAGALYFDDQLYAGGTNMKYVANSKACNVDGETKPGYAIRIKGRQFYFAVKLAPGATVRTYTSNVAYILSIAPTSSNLPDNEDTDSTDDTNIGDYILESRTTAGLIEYTNNNTDDEVVYVAALGYAEGDDGVYRYYNGGDSYITQIQVEVPEPSYEFGDFETDSGYYYNTAGDQTLGVIRFLQEFSGDTPTSYGFYFVDEEGNIKSYVSGDNDGEEATISSSKTLTGGFYGDLVDIASSESDKKFYALPFVTYGSTTYPGTFDADKHYGTANFDDLLSYNSYSDWKVGQVSSTDTDGAISVTEKDGKTALSIDSRNAYYTLDNAISEGTVTFSTDAYVPDTTNKLFRIHLENTADVNYQASDSSQTAFAEVVDFVSGGIYLGPGLKANDASGATSVASYEDSGWYHIEITIDYTDVANDEFITVSVTDPNGNKIVDAETIGSISNVDTTLNQIRLVGISANQYFANMKITTTE